MSANLTVDDASDTHTHTQSALPYLRLEAYIFSREQQQQYTGLQYTLDGHGLGW